METQRKALNKQQSELRRVMTSYEQHDEAMRLFNHQHARLHAQKMAQSEPWSFEDAVLDDMDEAHMRRIPKGCEHSMAWCAWHMARIEDVAMNLLVAGSAQVLNGGDWLARMKVRVRHTGNAMDAESVAGLSAAIDIEALRAYRVAVGRRTREVVGQLAPEALKEKVDPRRLQRVMDEGAVVEAARGVVDYWGRRNIAGLLLMPATRHNLIHLNEALRLKRRGD